MDPVDPTNPDDDRIVARLRSAGDVVPQPPHHADLLGRAERTSTRRRRSAGAAAVGLAAVVAAVAVVAVTAAGPDRGDEVDAANASEAPTPTASAVGCAGMTVASVSARTSFSTPADGLVLTLRNDGTSGCDVRGLEIVTKLSPRSISDRATPEDLRPGDPLADGTLAPGGEVLLLASTDTCQSAGAPVEVRLDDGTDLGFVFPGETSECNEPDFDIRITALGTTGTGDDLAVAVNPLTFVEDKDQPRGSARWDAERGTVTYVSPTYYGGCLADGTATRSGSTVELALESGVPDMPDGVDPDTVGCTTIALLVAATVYGLSEAPAELTVTEDGESVSVPVTS